MRRLYGNEKPCKIAPVEAALGCGCRLGAGQPDTAEDGTEVVSEPRNICS